MRLEILFLPTSLLVSSICTQVFSQEASVPIEWEKEPREIRLPSELRVANEGLAHDGVFIIKFNSYNFESFT